MEEAVSNEVSKSQVKIMLERELAVGEIFTVFGCLYKVPQILHDANKEAYTPKLISIGPYHCRSKNLLYMHSLKKGYLQSFLKRTKLELDTCIEMAQCLEKVIRGYYDEECGLNSDEFVHMILMDGIFIVEFTWRVSSRQNLGGEGLFRLSSSRDDIMRDLMLLENQLPFFFLKDLADLSFPGKSREWIVNLTKLFIHHLDSKLIQFTEPDGVLHLVDFIHKTCTSDFTFRGPKLELKLELSRSATELQEAGVKLGCSKDLTLTHIDFMEENGVLQIPRLVVNRNTESLFRNIIAYEHCHRKGHIFRSYVILMDCLINTSQDVQLLVDSEIIENSLGETEDVCTLFNNLYKMPMMDSSEFLYAELCQRLNKYSRNPWRKWKARWFRWKLMLSRDYFSSPWSIVSVIAAFVLLGLTTIQTICSIKSVKW